MPRKQKPKPSPWRSARQIRVFRDQLTAAIAQSEDDCSRYAVLDLKSARNLREICQQAIFMETRFQPSDFDLDLLTEIMKQLPL